MEDAARKEAPHIVLYIGSLQKGGAERVMGNLAEYFYAQGMRVTLVTTYFHPPEYVLPHGAWDPVTGEPLENESGIRRVYSDPPADLLTGGRLHNFKVRFDNLRGIWRRLSPDLILSFSGKNNLMAVATAKGLKHTITDNKGRQVRRPLPVVVSVRGMPAREYSGRGMKLCAQALFAHAAGVVLQTGGAAKYFRRAVRKKSVILPNSIHPAFLRPPYEGKRRKEVVCVGRLDGNKNQGMLIRAFAKTRDAHPEYTLHIYGDGRKREDFETLSEELGIRDRVVFHGAVSGVDRRIDQSEIFVLPSKTEGMPNALIEAMSLGLACISTDCPSYGPRDLIRDGENGFLVPVDRDDIMAEKLAVLMSDPSLRARLGAAAARVQELYNPDRINRQWLDYLKGLMCR